ncbi:hypothetical protein BAQU_1388 [Bifidobacterium aquikefiri]|uniref:Uncharacterized protein n=1 Tax=Bifidobacterium aquikefiri TaxID=1653207 RepID=A0A261G3Q4_9BIFI|nr:hypothetical protein BAQU_1388 [Bifidobacterium aquikefiri]
MWIRSGDREGGDCGDNKGCGFGRGDKGRGDGWDGGHRHWVVPALVVVLRCMVVPQCGYRVDFTTPRSRRIISQPKPQSGERLTACFTYTFVQCRYTSVKNIKQEQHPLPQGLGNDSPHTSVPIALVSSLPELFVLSIFQYEILAQQRLVFFQKR